MSQSPRPTRSEQKRAAILAAARLEFEEKGFQGASMDGISARAEVSKRTLYNHFANKEALFGQITECLWQQDDALEYRPDAPLAEQLSALAVKKLDLMAAPGYIGLARSVMGEYMRSPELAQAAMARFEQSEDGASAWFAAAMADGRLAPGDPKVVAHQFYGLLKTFALWPQLLAHVPAPPPEARAALVADTVALILGRYELP
ncbi:TetR/AcrR family transcriptional regulator [Ferrimonas balearica]|uniref:TetR/AcrR family transcriptional regulator n=1 Tax=Ferrimonas balearica TaxID=44012 RepID=UPI001C9A1E85|nr:TetR/AcrR family transcriptional regulator [Ferrimonas balearica]MBY5990611.1 TetR/AcrR family transcriptional regulator [Ferrimonas balearica]